MKLKLEMNAIMKVAVALALLFAVNMEADAQFGKLKGLADKAKKAVTGDKNSSTTSTTTTTTPAATSNNPLKQVTSTVKQVEAATDTPEEHERKVAEDAEYWMGKWYDEPNLSNSTPAGRKERAEQVAALKKAVGAQNAVVKKLKYQPRWGEDYFEDYHDFTHNNNLIQKHPEYDAKEIREIYRIPFVVYYKKDGKCYVTRGEFRKLSYYDYKGHGLKTGDSVAPDPNWNPGLHPAVEVPAEIYNQYIK